MDSKEFAAFVAKIADERKAENIRIIEVRDISGITDYFVLATGTSEPHLKAILNAVEQQTNEQLGIRPTGIDGKMPTTWVALDYFDVIVHIMTSEARAFYALENLWKDAPQFSLDDLVPGTAGTSHHGIAINE